jgi:hypothetical protein
MLLSFVYLDIRKGCFTRKFIVQNKGEILTCGTKKQAIAHSLKRINSGTLINTELTLPPIREPC